MRGHSKPFPPLLGRPFERAKKAPEVLHCYFRPAPVGSVKRDCDLRLPCEPRIPKMDLENSGLPDLGEVSHAVFSRAIYICWLFVPHCD